MINNVILPKQGLQMEEGTITKWLKKQGDRVDINEPLFEMETDKLNIEIPSAHSGTLLKILKEEGQTVLVAQTIAIIGDEDDDQAVIIDLDTLEDNSKQAEQRTENKGVTLKADNATNKKLFITPRAKTRAKEKDIDIGDIRGSGPDGIIIERDVLRFDDIKISTQKTSISKRGISFLMIEADLAQMAYLRDKYKERGLVISYVDIIIKAASRILDDEVEDIGYGMIKDKELVFTVISDAKNKSLAQINQAVNELKTNKTSKINIIDLGQYGIDFCQIAPTGSQSAVIGVGRAIIKPVVSNGIIEEREVINITLSYADGSIDTGFAVYFLNELKRLIETPLLMV